MREHTLFSLAGIAILLVGCTATPLPELSSSRSASASATPIASPSPTSSTSSLPTDTAPSASPEAPPADGGSDLTPDVLASLCVEKTRSYYAADAEFFPDRVRVEARKVDPPWLVIVPSRTFGSDFASVCTIGGTTAAPTFQVHAAQTPPTEQEIQDAVNGVQYYEGD